MSAPSPDLPLDLNAADAAALCRRVPGIGPALAGRIVAYREAHGPFGAVEELQRVAGIGPRLYERIAPRLMVAPSITEAGMERRQPGGPMAEAEPAPAPEIAMPPAEGEQPEVDAPQATSPQPEASDNAYEGRLHGLEEEAFSVEESMERRQTDSPVAEAEPAPAPEIAAPPVEGSQPEAAALQDSAPQGAPPPDYAAPYDSPAPQPAPRQGGFFRSLLLVIAGAILGTLLTLFILLLASGSLRYPSRGEFDALSRNVNTVTRAQQADADRLNVVEARLARLEALIDRVALLEKQVAALGTQVERLGTQVDALRADLTKMQEDVARLDKAVSDLKETVETLKTRVQRFDSFFASLRDLLIELEGAPAGR